MPWLEIRMFAPDGRNSLQTLGHGVVSVAKFLITVFGILALLPTFLFFIARYKLQVQEATIMALNDPGPKSALVVDFNEATLGTYDGPLAQAWIDARYPGLNPTLRTLPFSVTLVYDRPTGWEPEEDPEANDRTRWVYYNLPFDQRLVEDEHFEKGIKANVWRTGQDHYEVLEPLAKAIKKHDLLGISAAFTYSDPWWASGAFKLAPTKNWDWNSGFELVHAKSASNYRAYVGAARAVSRMRQLYACRATGLPFDITWNSETTPSWLVAKAGWHGEDYARAYRTAFKGGLPVVLLHLQNLEAKSIEHDDRWIAFKSEMRTKDLDTRADIGLRAPASTPFVTGMHLWTGYHSYGLKMGRPVFSYSDFFLNSTPEVSPDARDAQRALLQLLTDEFWFKFFPRDAHGEVHRVLEAERVRLGRDTHFARMLGHNAYYCMDSK